MMASTITELKEPCPGWRYHSGTAVYVERMRDGRLIAAELQSTGIPFYNKHEDPDSSAFDLQVDGRGRGSASPERSGIRCAAVPGGVDA
jgi:hypothetical protein